ncbi:MAG: dihydroorotase [Cyanobacteria bacterium J06576_12]
MAQLIKHAYLVSASANVDADGTGDVLIDDGRITAIAPFITDTPPDTEIIDGRGQFLGPGLIDLYSQSGEPGHESRETLASLRQAATAGGFTRVGLLPNTQPVTDSVEAIAAIYQTSRFDAASQTQLLPWAAITLGAKGEQLTELAELADAGALGFADGLPLTNKALLRRLLEYAQPLQKPIALCPCDPQLAGSGSAREGADALRLGLAGVSAIAETTALATLLECIVEVPALVHVMRVSTARGVELLRQAKSRNLPVSASVAWHHLLFDTTDLSSYSPSLRHDPPLGTPADRQALVEGVEEGVIDAIAIDHSPYTYEEKTVSFDAAPPGAIGLELALPVLWQIFVAHSAESSGRWSPMQLWQSLSAGPAQCLGLSAGQLEVGVPAELVLFDPQISWEVSPSNLKSLAENTPWLGQTIQGKVSRVWYGCRD